MGANRRYAESVDRAIANRIGESVMNGGEQPSSLSSQELELGVYPLTRTPVPVPVRAWVRYGAAPVRVDAAAVAWTSKAVALVWYAPGGQHRAWVWASAVERRYWRGRGGVRARPGGSTDRVVC